ISGKRRKFGDRFFYAVNIPYDDKGYSSIPLNFLVLLDETELQSMIRNAWFTLAAISIVMLLFIFLISFLFSNDILEAFKVLAESMKNFRKEDNSKLQNLISSRRDEIAEMANVCLALNTDLKTYQNHLEELVRIKTDELTQSNKKLDKLLEDLQTKQLQIEHEFVVAQSLQSHLVPDPNKLIAPLQVHCIYQPASGVSGDIYDFGMLGNEECYFFMADVSGHGIPAAMVTAMIKISLGKIPLRELDPKDTLTYLNHEMVELLDDHYFTAFLCKVNFRTKTLVYANAGGTPGILVKTLRNSTKLLKPTGSVIGVFEDFEIHSQNLKIEAGDKLFIYTDGISEQKSPQKKLFGLRKILKHLKEYRFYSHHEILETLLRKLVHHAATTHFDDDVSCIIANLG
ncbi:MAG: serine/threonine-protein phosphatase, partial [Leptospiraceae bacterium]|nr:serine/threonine-protein phosphatase [Leptospiraceae bacterium]